MSNTPNLLQRLKALVQTPVTENSQTTINSQDMERLFGSASFTQLINVVDEVSMTELRTILHNAEGGNLGHLYEIYQLMVSSDARIAGMVNNRKVSVSRASRNITADSDNPTAMEAKDLIERNLRLLNWEQQIRQMLDAIYYGVSIHEKVWSEVNGKLMVTEMHKIHNRRIRQNNSNLRLTRGDSDDLNDKYGELYLLQGEFGKRIVFLDELPPYKLIVGTAIDVPSEYARHGLFRPIVRWWVLKTFIVKCWAQYAEKHGFPIPIAKMPQEEYEKQKDAVKKILQSVGKNRYGIFFDNMEYEIVNAAQSANIEVFEKYINLCNTEMAVALLGQNLTTEVSGGSFAAAETHKDVLDDLIQEDIEFLDELIQKQFIEPLVRVNFPDLPIEDYPRYTSETHRNVDLMAFSNGVAGMSKLIEIPKDWIYKQSQIPMPSEDEDVIGGFNPDPRNPFDPDRTN